MIAYNFKTVSAKEEADKVLNVFTAPGPVDIIDQLLDLRAIDTTPLGPKFSTLCQNPLGTTMR